MNPAKAPLLTPEEIADALGRPRPTPEQSAIISSPLVPRLVVAGAGSGKTATMVDRVVWLVANGLVRADQVLGVTFTRKAAGELRERMRSRLEELRRQGLVRPPSDSPDRGQEQGLEPAGDPTVSTYHSYANTLVSQYGLRIGLEQDAQMLGGAQAWQLVSQLVEHYDGRLPEKEMSKESLVQGVMQLAGDCSEHLVDPDALIEWCEQQLNLLGNLSKPTVAGATNEHRAFIQGLDSRLVLAELVKRYSRVKSRMQVMDYGDLISYAAKIARTVPTAAVTERDRYRVVLLDEFQDTSHAQMQLFSDLFGGRNGAEPHPVMAVGDPKQSIYGFRGASSGQLFSFYDYFPAEDRTASYLTVAWRNDTAILHAANLNAAPLGIQPDWERSAHTIEVPPLVPRPQPGTGQVLVGEYLTDRQEARAIAQTIANQRAPHQNKPLHQMPTMAVLCKKRAQMGPVREAFEELGIPYQVVGLGGLLDTPEIVDLVAILRVLADPGRSDALMRILSGARWRLGVSDLLAFSDWADYLKRQREYEIRFGLTAETAAARLQEEDESLHQARERTLSSRQDLEEARADSPEAQDRYRRILDAAAPDISDGASLVEALETLPAGDWVSPVTGRSISSTGLARLQALRGELAYLRQFTADDLGTLITEIERLTLLDIELAARPGTRSHAARRHLDAFYDVAASYEQAAPRINALLLASSSGEDAQEDQPQVSFSLSASGASASGITGFLAWLDAATKEENGLDTVVDAPRHDAVQILTVHASKGLEWDQVYIPGIAAGEFPDGKDERWTKKTDTLPWPLRGDANFLPPWRSDHENLRDFGTFMAVLKEQALEYREAEERRLSYVGMTRARSLLMLTSSVWKGTATKPRELSDFLLDLLIDAENPQHPDPQLAVRDLGRLDPDQYGTENPQGASILTALWPYDPLEGPQTQSWDSLEELNSPTAEGEEPAPAPGLPSPRQVVEEAAHNVLAGGLDPAALKDLRTALGDMDPATADSTSRTISDWQEETNLLLKLLSAPAPSRSFDLPNHLSASQLVQLAADPEGFLRTLRRPMPAKPGIAARQGTLFHSWIEAHYEAQTSLDMDEDLYEEDDTADLLDLPQLQENFLASRWAERTPWAIEYPIETPIDGVSFRGRVDAIFCTETEDGPLWELVDWKTGRVPRDLKTKSLQLALYRVGFARLMDIPEDRIKTFFYYVQADDPRDVTGMNTEKDIKRHLNKVRTLGEKKA